MKQRPREAENRACNIFVNNNSVLKLLEKFYTLFATALFCSVNFLHILLSVAGRTPGKKYLAEQQTIGRMNI